MDTYPDLSAMNITEADTKTENETCILFIIDRKLKPEENLCTYCVKKEAMYYCGNSVMRPEEPCKIKFCEECSVGHIALVQDGNMMTLVCIWCITTAELLLKKKQEEEKEKEAKLNKEI